jgi:hypothetical protein
MKIAWLLAAWQRPFQLKPHSQAEKKFIGFWKANTLYLRFNLLKQHFRASAGWLQ